MNFCSIPFRAIAGPLFISLLLSAHGECAFAEIVGATCPPDFTCFPPEPRDGACEHPALVLDTKSKSMHYDSDKSSEEYEKTCIAQTMRRRLVKAMNFT